MESSYMHVVTPRFARCPPATEFHLAMAVVHYKIQQNVKSTRNVSI